MMKGKVVTALAASMLLGATAAASASGFHVSLQQVGSDVVATGSGAIDLTGLGPSGSESIFVSGFLQANIGDLTVGGGPGTVDLYLGKIFGPASFGSGSTGHFASSGSLNPVGISMAQGPGNIFDEIVVPHGYVSDTVLSDSSTFSNATFAGLGVTPGVYVWTWGTGADQSFTLEVGSQVATPLPAALPLFATGFAFAGLLGWRRKRRAAGTTAD